MNVLQQTRNELNLGLKQNRPDRSYRDTLLIVLKQASTVIERLIKVMTEALVDDLVDTLANEGRKTLS